MNRALKLYDLGYTDLVSVAPPGVLVSSRSGLDPQDLGKRPAKPGVHGWYGYHWHKHQPTRAEAEAYDAWGSNIGLRGDRFPALDIDCMDEELVREIMSLALAKLGRAPVRVGKRPKALLVYRLDGEGFGRLGVDLGNGHLVEFLSTGRQYLVAGTHPSGVEYEWLGTPLWELEPSSLSLVTAAQIEAFMEELAERFGGEIQGRASLDTHPIPQEELLAPSLEALAKLVAEIPNDFADRDDYITFGHAVKAAAGEHEEDGFAIYAEWCGRWEDGVNEPDVVRADWRRMHPPFRVGWSYLVDKAPPAFNEAVWLFEPDPEYELPATQPVSHEDSVSFTDDWIAEQIVPQLRDKLRYDYPNDRWHCWDGSRWAHANMGEQEREVLYALRRFAAHLRAKAQAMPEKAADRAFKTVAKLGNAGVLSNVTRMLQSHRAIVVGPDAFDQSLWELNTPGGVVDLKAGLPLRKSDPTAMHSKATSVTPKQEPAPLWEKFLYEVTRGDRNLRRYMQKLCGYALTGVTYEQTLNFIWGDGGNGKGVFLNTIVKIMGEYTATAPMDTFASTKSDKHPTDLAGLMGARLVTSSETQKGRSWDEQRVKALTGGDRIRARFMRQDFVEFQPRFKLIIIGNHEPQIRNVDEAMRRRIHIVPFTFTPPVKNLRLEEELEAEHPAILAWMIEGCLLWQSEGLTPPDCVLLRTQQYFEEEDRPGLWLEASTQAGGYMTSTDAYRSWTIWCTQQGEQPGTQRNFTKALRPVALTRGITYGQVGPKENRQRGWKGVSLTDNPNDIQGEL